MPHGRGHGKVLTCCTDTAALCLYGLFSVFQDFYMKPDIKIYAKIEEDSYARKKKYVSKSNIRKWQ